MIRLITNLLFLSFWAFILVALCDSRESFELAQWLSLILLSVIGLMIANHYLDIGSESK